jgi:microcystin-dependent protein
MSDNYLGEIRSFGFNFPPFGWALCNGQLLAISSNTALFSLLGTMYGGDGVSTFALPNLQGRVGLHASSTLVEGEQVGLDPSMPTTVNAVTSLTIDRSLTSAASATTTVTAESAYAENRQPALVVNFCIATQGIFPSRN